MQGKGKPISPSFLMFGSEEKAYGSKMLVDRFCHGNKQKQENVGIGPLVFFSCFSSSSLCINNKK